MTASIHLFLAVDNSHACLLAPMMMSVLEHAHDGIALRILGDRISPRFSEALDRLIRTLLAGIAGRKHGITDPFFVDPRRVDHGVPAP